MASKAKTAVHKRRVFYLPGYDPFPPRRYRELYRTQGAMQARISGYALDVDPAGPRDGYGWRVRARIGAAQTETDVEVLVWSDLVRRSMGKSVLSTYVEMVRTAWIYLSSGALWRLARLRKGPVIAALYPVAALLVQAVLAVSLAAGAGFLAGGWLGAGAGIAAGAVVLLALLAWFRRLDRSLYAYYLMHDYAYSAGLRGRNRPELDARIDRFAERIVAALADPQVDEVLVVGHSSGAQLAVHVLARLAERGRLPDGGPRLGLLTLGQVIPMVSFLPEAWALRADLRALSINDRIAWVDVSAPGDGCCFALCDPVAVSGVAPPGQRWPLVISAAFTQTLSPARWKALRWRFFRLHFQYLCAFDRPGDYDYFQITAGPLTLADRFRGRQPSNSRIEAAVSPHTTMVA